VTTQYGVEKDIKMSLNETVEIKGYAFTFKGVSALQGANYTGNKGVIDVVYQGAKIATLKPEKRQYVTGMPMTEAAIDPSLFRDLYIALGESLGEGAWSFDILMSFSTPYCVVTVAPNKNTAMPMCATTIPKNAVPGLPL
jgi:cytochrome c-type biogenesis protein CcmF